MGPRCEDAPRRGARRLARGTRFLRTPGIDRHEAHLTLKGCRGFLAPCSGCANCWATKSQGYAKNAYPWLIFLHRSAVRFSLFLLIFCATAAAQTPRVSLVPLLSGLAQPVFLTNSKDGTNRLFIVEQAGRIRVLQPGAATATLFLDLTSRVLAGGERGLLGLAFHPQFSTNRRLYVNYTRRPDGATVVAEYRDGVEQRILLTVPQPYENHNGGMIEFGPDGYLYIGMGDGGSGNDPQNRAQDLTELLGKILRINVDAADSRPEIFAYGFRNPWRFSFDRLTGQLYVGDVGQNAREEIDIVTQGGNYGWRVWEGTLCTGLGPAPCSAPGFIAPIADYINTGSDGRCAIIGGYVYRGTQASLPYGAYIYGDLCSGEIFMLKDGVQTVLLNTALQISSFGEDEAGELFVLDLNGSIFRLVNPDATNAAERPYAIGDTGAFVTSTAEAASVLSVGYARIRADAGQSIPSGLAIFALQQHGVLVSEASVPASRPILAGRVFAEAGPDVNTGIALANPNDQPAILSFYLTDVNGTDFGAGTVTIPPRQQVAAFLNQPPFNGTNSIFGTFTFTSSVSVGAIALRGFTNDRGEFLITTLPVVDIGITLPESTTIAHFADGGGWTTQIVLVNPSDAVVNGNVQFISRAGQIIQTMPYTVRPRSATRVATAGSGSSVQTGSVRILSAVSAFSIFALRSSGVTVTQAGMPTAAAGTAFQTYVEIGGAIRSGIAIANPSSSAVDVRLDLAGRTTTLSIPPNGQTALFVDEVPGLSDLAGPFQGVLRISAATPVAVTALRGHTNQRGEFLITATAPLDESARAGNPELLFPHFAEGAGYSMQFILFGRAASGTISFFDQAGNPASLAFR